MNEIIQTFLVPGNIGFYSFYKSTMIILQYQGKLYNYFTSIDFSQKYGQAQEFQFLTKSPITINSDIKLLIASETIHSSNFCAFWNECVTKNQYTNNGTTIFLDHTFESPYKYIPTVDPTGGHYNLHVPIEKYLYGSNFIGNYYIFELFSDKSLLRNILSDKDITAIQKHILSCGLGFHLNVLQDRIGNIVCKFNVETIEYTPKLLGAEHGITIALKKAENVSPDKQYVVKIEQEFDKTIYSFSIKDPFCFSEDISIPPNQYINRITLWDKATNLILFAMTLDYTVSASYESIIGPPDWVFTSSCKHRVLLREEGKIDIPLDSRQALGSIYAFIEPYEVEKYRNQEHDLFLREHLQLLSYNNDSHEQAIIDIRNIINFSQLLWDLKEIMILDPYLSSDDIINTACYCQKEGIKVRAICCYGDIHNNSQTASAASAHDYESFRKEATSLLKNTLGETTDIQLEYRSIRGKHGKPFHDRYLIMRYAVNGCKVWSLGSSINSIGQRHSIIQVVATPTLIENVFEGIWMETENEECLIYKNFSSI